VSAGSWSGTGDVSSTRRIRDARKLTLATIAKRSAFAMAGLVLAANMDVAGASSLTESPGASAKSEVQRSVRVADVVAVVTRPKYAKSTHLLRKKPRRSQKTWLNPQPEPPWAPRQGQSGWNMAEPAAGTTATG